MFSPVSPDGSPARAYAVVRRTRRRGGAVRVAAAQGLDALLTRPQGRRPRAVGASAIRILAQVADGRIEDTDHGSTAVLAAREDRAGERQKAPHQVQPRDRIAWGHRVDDGAALQWQIVDHGPAVLPVDERGCPCDRRQLGTHGLRDGGRAFRASGGPRWAGECQEKL